MQTATHKRNVLDTALALLRGIAQDDRWITVHPNGPDAVGRPVLIDESGTIKAGMGGKFNGRNIDDVPRGKNPHPVTEEKWQARQKRMEGKGAASTEKQPAPQQPSQQQAGGGGEGTAEERRKTAESLADKYHIGLVKNSKGYDIYVPAGLGHRPQNMQEINEHRDEILSVVLERKEKRRAEREQSKGNATATVAQSTSTPMAGTAKQVEWAEKIKKEKLDLDTNSLKLQIMSMAKSDPAKMEKLKAIGKMSNEQVAAITDAVKDKDASWWIDNRNTPKEALIVKTWFDSLGKAQQQTSVPSTATETRSSISERGKELINRGWLRVKQKDGQDVIYSQYPDVVKKLKLGDEIKAHREEIIAELKARNAEKTRQESSAKTQQAEREAKISAIPGLSDLRNAQRENSERREQFSRAMERESGPRTGNDPKHDIEGMSARYPQAAAYLKAEKAAESSNPDKAAIGRRAMEKVLAGNWQEAMTDMEKEEKAQNERHMWDSALGTDSVHRLALDRNSVRTKDENGYLHVKSSHISKATVNPYYGKEIPGWREDGLEPDKIYYGLRDPEELKKSVPTWAGLPIHIEHHIDSAEDPQKLTRVGTVGTEIVWNDPYLDAPLTIWDQTAIDGIEDDSFRELSCAYRYEPDFTPGVWNGKHYDFVMRNIRGNHVALVEEGRAGSDVLVADAKPEALRKRDIIDMALDILRKAAEDLKNKEGQVPEPANTNSLKKEGLMSRFRKWFGAQDSEPAPKEEKVDLVQAILDLHRRDPKTGELREDVQEDADKVAELKVLVEGMRGKLPPEDLERLIEAVVALSEAEEAVDEDPLALKKEDEVDNVHADAMRKAGCDAEDPDEARAFAGGVAYGEELERNPAEREKLDREHESEGMQRAMDRCGVDAENPAETRAFAEGVKYGEEAERAKAEAKDADLEGGENAELVKKDEKPAEVGKDEDKDAMIKKILAAVPELTEEQKKKIQDTLGDLAYVPATGDEDLEKKVEGAADRALRKRRFLGATDAARIRAQATKDAMDRMRQIADACRVVRPLVGEMDALGFDSANDVYGYTLEQLGKDPMKYDRKAWRGMVAMLLDGQAAMARDSKPAINSKPIPDSGPFRYLKNITISG